MIFGKNRWARNPRRERALAHLVLMLMPDIKIKAHFIEHSHRTENLPQGAACGLGSTVSAAPVAIKSGRQSPAQVSALLRQVLQKLLDRVLENPNRFKLAQLRVSSIQAPSIECRPLRTRRIIERGGVKTPSRNRMHHPQTWFQNKRARRIAIKARRVG